MKSITLHQAGQMVAAMDAMNDKAKDVKMGDEESKDVEMVDICETGPYNLRKRKRLTLDPEESLAPKTKKPKTIESVGLAEANGTSPTAKCDPPPTLESDHQFLCQFYPQCRSDVILAKLTEKKDAVARVYEVAKDMEREYDYPRWEDIKPVTIDKEGIGKLHDLDWHFEDLVENYQAFLEGRPANGTTPSINYQLHVVAQLKFDFPMYNVQFIMTHVMKNRYHYRRAYESLASANPPKYKRVYKKAYLMNRRQFDDNRPNYPKEPDVRFFQELLIFKNEDKIRGEVEKRQQARATRFEQQKLEGLLESCGCCCSEEMLVEDMCGCPGGHRFCKTCVGQSTEVVVGQARGKVPCLDAECDLHYTLPVIERCVAPRMFSLLAMRLQHEELESANIPNLASCPFCDYATIIDDPAVTVLKCLHPSCLKETCRLCKSPNHLPLNCQEYKEYLEERKNIRLNIENMLSEAVIRECHNCKKRFQRTEGCPVMTCVCGSIMCYICRQVSTNAYLQCGCENLDAEIIHAKELVKAMEEAKEKYLSHIPNSGVIISIEKIDELIDKNTRQLATFQLP